MSSQTDLEEFNILIVGVGGQGVVLAATIIGNAAVKRKINVRTADTFGAAQRGGTVLSHIRMGTEVYGPLVPVSRCNVLLGLEPVEALRVAEKYLSSKSFVIINTKPIFSVDVSTGKATYPSIDTIFELLKTFTKGVMTINATEQAIKIGDPIYTNMIMLGALAATNKLPLTIPDLRAAIIDVMPLKKHDLNLKAFDYGIEVIKEERVTSSNIHQ